MQAVGRCGAGEDDAVSAFAALPGLQTRQSRRETRGHLLSRGPLYCHRRLSLAAPLASQQQPAQTRHYLHPKAQGSAEGLSKTGSSIGSNGVHTSFSSFLIQIISVTTQLALSIPNSQRTFEPVHPIPISHLLSRPILLTRTPPPHGRQTPQLSPPLKPTPTPQESNHLTVQVEQCIFSSFLYSENTDESPSTGSRQGSSFGVFCDSNQSSVECTEGGACVSNDASILLMSSAIRCA